MIYIAIYYYQSSIIRNHPWHRPDTWYDRGTTWPPLKMEGAFPLGSWSKKDGPAPPRRWIAFSCLKKSGWKTMVYDVYGRCNYSGAYKLTNIIGGAPSFFRIQRSWSSLRTCSTCWIQTPMAWSPLRTLVRWAMAVWRWGDWDFPKKLTMSDVWRRRLSDSFLLHIVEPFEGNIGWETVGVVLGYIFWVGQNL